MRIGLFNSAVVAAVAMACSTNAIALKGVNDEPSLDDEHVLASVASETEAENDTQFFGKLAGFAKKAMKHAGPMAGFAGPAMAALGAGGAALGAQGALSGIKGAPPSAAPGGAPGKPPPGS